MNFTPTFGWYYRSLNNRAPAWTSVEFFYRFLIENTDNPIGSGIGPFAKEAPLAQVEPGDFIQLGRREGEFYHTLPIVGFRGDVPFVAAHTNDAYNRPITSYSFERLRCIHILGARRLE